MFYILGISSLNKWINFFNKLIKKGYLSVLDLNYLKFIFGF